MVEFKVNSQWEKGMEGQFIITNNSDKVLENWRLRFKFDHEITSLWDGVIESHKKNVYIIKHPSWNQSIPIGGKAIIGFNGKLDENLKVPYDCTIPIEKTDTPKEDYSITYKVSSDWKDAFNGEISITNNTATAIEWWSLEFDFDCKINNFWTAKIVKQDGNHYTIKHDDWNSIIASGQTIQLGFEARPGGTLNEPRNFKLVKNQLDDSIESNPDENLDNGEFT